MIMSIADELTTLNTVKQNIKSAIAAKGIAMNGVAFTGYHTKIAEISSDWARPVDWLTLPAVGNTEQKLVGLHAVYNHDSNFIAFTCAGDYTVNWGDGTIENFASNVQASHSYLYFAIPSNTLSSLGYKQVIVTVTPQNGKDLTLINLCVRHNQNAQKYSTGWLDILLSGTLLTTLTVCSDPNIVSHGSLKQFALISSNNITDFGNMFNGCANLESVPLLHTKNGTNFSSMFLNCVNLQSVPLFDTAKATNFSDMFNNCYSLKTVPLFNTQNVTTFARMFDYAASLQTVPAFNTIKGTNFSYMFEACASLQSVDTFNTSNGINFSYMFSGCAALQAAPEFDVSKGTNVTNMFVNCSSLSKGKLTGTKSAISYNKCRLSADALADIFTGLATVASGTITITNNWGTALLTTEQRAIATGKGWTIAG